MANGRLRLAGVIAAVAIVGVYYAVADPASMLVRLEIAFSGKVSAHARQTNSVPGAPARVLVPYEAGKLFSAKGKGPRADLYLEVHGSAYAPHPKRRVVAALTPVDLEITGSVADAPDEDHVVNRTKKGHRLKPPVTTIVKVAPKTVEVEPAPPARNATASLFLASIKDSIDQRFEGKSIYDQLPPDGPEPIARSSQFKGESELDYQRRQRRCLATAIYFEARGEPVEGQLAVAQVVMNRVRSPAYPDTICGVVYQGQLQRAGCQFSFTCDGRSDVARSEAHWNTSLELAKKVLAGKAWLEEIDSVTHYHATYVKPPWRRSMEVVKTIGRHIFYRAPAVPIREEDELEADADEVEAEAKEVEAAAADAQGESREENQEPSLVLAKNE